MIQVSSDPPVALVLPVAGIAVGIPKLSVEGFAKDLFEEVFAAVLRPIPEGKK